MRPEHACHKQQLPRARLQGPSMGEPVRVQQKKAYPNQQQEENGLQCPPYISLTAEYGSRHDTICHAGAGILQKLTGQGSRGQQGFSDGRLYKARRGAASMSRTSWTPGMQRYGTHRLRTQTTTRVEAHRLEVAKKS
jgi:hypothetical protein